MSKYFLAAFVLVGLLLASGATQACLNDRDTVAEEARAAPDVYRATIGWFDRNPPLYYQMRIERVTKELQTDPSRLSDYDDIAVAYDRLGKDDSAIAWIKKKRAHLPPLAGASPEIKEQWYRYHANLGTFLLHRWAAAGANRKTIDQVIAGRDEIALAIKINPNAHFGREACQLAVMNWMIDITQPAPPNQFRPPLFEYVDIAPSHPHGYRRQDTLRGLSGLVMLGGAWESPDIFQAMSALLSRSDMSEFTEMRAIELVAAGRKPLDPRFPESQAAAKADMASSEAAGDSYIKLRRQADQYEAKRTAFMMARLLAGRHPDTDPTFWNGWHDEDPPVPPMPISRAIYVFLGKPGGSQEGFNMELLFFGGLAILCLTPILLYVRRRRAYRQALLQRMQEDTSTPKP